MRQGREEKEGHNETGTGGERGTRDWMRRPRELVTLVGFDEGGMKYYVRNTQDGIMSIINN